MRVVDIKVSHRAFCELAGLALIIAGTVVQTRMSAYFDFFGGTVSAAAVLLIIVGVIIFIIGFFGCCGAYKENYCMTMTFAVLLVIIFILELAAGIAAYVKKNEVQDIILDGMTNAMTNYGSSDGVTKAWDELQTTFECCGVENTTDWSTQGPFNTTTLPGSCCANPTMNGLCSATANDVYDEGCLDQFVEWVEDNIYTIAGIGIGLAFVQIIGIIIACCLAQTIRKEYETV